MGPSSVSLESLAYYNSQIRSPRGGDQWLGNIEHTVEKLQWDEVRDGWKTEKNPYYFKETEVGRRRNGVILASSIINYCNYTYCSVDCSCYTTQH